MCLPWQAADLNRITRVFFMQSGEFRRREAAAGGTRE